MNRSASIVPVEGNCGMDFHYIENGQQVKANESSPKNLLVSDFQSTPKSPAALFDHRLFECFQSLPLTPQPPYGHIAPKEERENRRPFAHFRR
jgi:hypothetical protein